MAKTQKMLFAVEDIQLVNADVDQSQFSLLSVDAFATGRSAHDTFVTEETLARTAKTIIQKPFVFAINKQLDDLGSHDKTEVPGGFVPHNTPIEFKRLPDGRLMMSVQVLVWKRYSGELLRYFARDDNRKGVSVEIEVYDSRVDVGSGLTEIVDFCYNAITALGDFVQSAIPNAQAVMQFSQDYNKDKQDFLFSSKYNDVDMSIPTSVKKMAQSALEDYVADAAYVSPMTLAVARFLTKNEKATPERIRQIKRFFNKKNLDMADTTVNFWGGESAHKWSEELCMQLDEIDDKRLSYFEADDSANTEMMIDSEPQKPDVIVDNYKGMEEETDMAEAKLKEEGTEAPVEEMAADGDGTGAAPVKEEMSAEAPKEFSLGDFVDPAFAGAFLKNAIEDEDADKDFAGKMQMAADEFAKEGEKDFATLMNGMYAAMKYAQAKMQKMAEDSKVYMAENEELKKFKADSEGQQKQFAVDATLKELSEKLVIPEETLTALRTEADKFSLAEIDGWKNFCKAQTWEFAVTQKKPKTDEDELMVFDTGWGKKEVQTNIWANIN